MKIRNGFVSNSSSSSFIIGIRENTTADDIRNALREKKQSIQDYLEEYGEYFYEKFESYEEYEDFLVSYILSNYAKSNVKFDKWLVSADKFSNEDGDPFGGLFYSMIDIDKDYLKILASN